MIYMLTLNDIAPDDVYKRIPIFSLMLMYKSNNMHELMYNCCISNTFIRQWNILWSTSTSKIGETPKNF